MVSLAGPVGVGSGAGLLAARAGAGVGVGAGVGSGVADGPAALRVPNFALGRQPAAGAERDDGAAAALGTCRFGCGLGDWLFACTGSSSVGSSDAGAFGFSGVAVVASVAVVFAGASHPLRTAPLRAPRCRADWRWLPHMRQPQPPSSKPKKPRTILLEDRSMCRSDESAAASFPFPPICSPLLVNQVSLGLMVVLSRLADGATACSLARPDRSTWSHRTFAAAPRGNRGRWAHRAPAGLQTSGPPSHCRSGTDHPANTNMPSRRFG